MKTTNFDPDHILQIVQLLLMQLEDTLSGGDDINEDTRSDKLNAGLQSARDKAARLRSALAKHRASEKRKQELNRDNERRNPKPTSGKTRG
jgi:hypothetical protein